MASQPIVTHQTRPQLPPSTSSTITATIPTSTPPKPSVSLPSSSHLDPGTYVRGTHPITIGQNVVIHPRAHLSSIHGPLLIGDDCIVSERCILGGPVLSAGAVVDPVAQTLVTTQISSAVYLHPASTVEYGCTIGSSVILESNATVCATSVVGKHSKICAGVSVPSATTVADWTVVYGDGNVRRSRRRMGKQLQGAGVDSDVVDEVEEARLAAMQKERQGSLFILRNNALKTVSGNSARKK